MKRVKRYDLRPCPKCGGLFVDVWRTMFTGTYHCECKSCHYATKGSSLVFIAKWRWNHGKEIPSGERDNKD